jgi:CheY-like chemotaxis protein
MNEKTVLVVDDDQDIRTAVGLALGIEGIHAVEAQDGADALERLKRLEPHPALVLLDMMMPGMCGNDVLRALRADPSFADVPVVVLSGDTAAVRNAIALGANGSMAKPIGIESLLETVRHYVR